MNNLCVLLISVICLIQNAYSQCLGPAGTFPNGYGLGYGPGIGIGPGIAPGFAGPAGIAPGYPGIAPALEAPLAVGGYGGSGVGDVAVAGEMPVAGTTLVAGQVPILGAVRFAGDLPAIGTVSIAGSCGCGCGAPGYYY
ncbi:chorion class CA protein ERA.1-like [Nymphalis io]|uniref:chorion class CA protein ERA.1-like n=1 Tax=Inachis io TaxID=171585 RepID=UPI002167471B|nr:chorion class CA protein ERA.1-like [Nymphalis io]